MKKLLLNPLFAPLFLLIYLWVFMVTSFFMTPNEIFYFCNTQLELITFVCYALSFIAILFYYFRLTITEKNTFIWLVFLWTCALFREMGIQHWLTQTDTTAFKLRFFLNPINPLHEKILAAFMLVSVGIAATYMLIKFTPRIVRGFFKIDPFYWTVCFLGGIGIVAKFADRFPSNYFKSTGTYLPPRGSASFNIIEEASESTLPILFALALIQYYLMTRAKKVETAPAKPAKTPTKRTKKPAKRKSTPKKR